MLDFNNTEIAFSAKSQSELKNAYLLFNTCLLYTSDAADEL